ncbi:MAG: phenylalanine--tRNA ligase subunit beta [Alphaproteobacteria bacterium]
MKWSYEWLREYLDTEYTPNQIEEKLNLIGLEVEDFIAPLPVIAAKIIECKPHPDSDHLHILQVDDGTGKMRQVVCGAPNVRVGMVSALARPGCKIGDMEIKSGKLRGVVSDGMMCSEREIGIGNNHDGIIELDMTPGEIVECPCNSIIFDTGITPNRPDQLAVRGIALDLSASGVGKYIACDYDVIPDKVGTRKVNLIADKSCLTYRFCEIHNVKNTNSDKKISGFLTSAGINPKNALIDATNYICYDMAQPMHCFDADLVNGDITVRMAKNGEKFTDLFGTEHELQDCDLVIADDTGILALAGIIGGARAMTSDSTKNIILESAYFEPVGIRKTSKRLGLSTDSSYRYERGIDPDLTGRALSYAVKIIQDRCGGEIVNITTAGRKTYTAPVIKYNPNYCAVRTGLEMDSKTQLEILSRLQFKVVENKDGTWDITPRSARVDMTAPENIASDLIRIYGYEKIGINGVVDTANRKPSTLDKKSHINIKKQLCNRGLNESVSFGFSSSRIQEMLITEPAVRIANPITVDLDVARGTLLSNMLIALSDNIKRGFPNVNIFELGNVFYSDEPNGEKTSVCIVRSGETSPKHWTSRNRSVDVFDVKSDILSLIGSQKYTIETDNAPLWAHPYKYGRIVQGKKVIAEFGELHPSVAKQMRIKQTTVIGIIPDVNNLPDYPKYKKTPVSEFQPITRDFAFIVDKYAHAQDLTSVAMSCDSRISDVVIFDSFDMGDGKKSIAFTITIYPTENMSDSDLLKIQDNVIETISKKCNAVIRDR